jgi:hypothetical protein
VITDRPLAVLERLGRGDPQVTQPPAS